jgi:hypothetical protein
MGKSVHQELLTDMQHSINLEQMPKGIYFIEIRTNNNKLVKKLIKE